MVSLPLVLDLFHALQIKTVEENRDHDVGANLHGRHGVGPQLPVVLDRDIPPLLKLEAGINCKFFSCGLSECLSPLSFAWVLLLLEIFVAF